MKILEARDGFIKFETAGNISVTSFVQVQGDTKNYVAQVLQIKKSSDKFIAYAKILFIFDEVLFPYDKTLPNKDAKISLLNFEVINKSFDAEKTVSVGSYIGTNTQIKIDTNSFDKNLLVSIDSPEKINNLISNLKTQFKKTLIIDMLGVTNPRKYFAGSDFKLPLDASALEFMYEDCLNDATSDSKNLIKEIFQDLADYAKTVKFLPFSALKTIIDNMVEKQHIFKLLVLKNKLAKFEKLGYFAGTLSEAENLENILNKDSSVIDLSKLDPIFQNRYLKTIYSLIRKSETKPQIFVIASNAIDKRNIRTIIATQDLASTLIVHSRFKYINEIKPMFKNFIIEPNFANNDVFKNYSSILNCIPKEANLVVGEMTEFIPVACVNKQIEDAIETIEITSQPVENDEILLEEVVEDVETGAINKKANELIEKISEEIELSEGDSSITTLFDDLEEEVNEADSTDSEDELSEVKPEDEYKYHTEVDPITTIEINEDIERMTEESDVSVELDSDEIEPVVEVAEISTDLDENTQEETDYQEEIIEISNDETQEIVIEDSMINYEFENQNIAEEQPQKVIEEVVEQPQEAYIPLTTEESFDDEIVEIEDLEPDENDIIVEIEETDFEEEDSLDKQIIEDVDKVFTTIKDDTLTESDLDFIDELNNESGNTLKEEEITLSDGMEELTELQESDEESEDGFLEPLEEINDLSDLENEKEVLETRNTSTPIVPVYAAEIPQEDLVTSDPIEQGDTVTHAKYGIGVVEKMIKYGTKTLFSINFDNVGRRLLDPTLTEIKKS